MALRVKVEIKSRRSNKVKITAGLVNSGYEAVRPHLLTPIELARIISLWPLPEDARTIELGTAGGPVTNWIIKDAIEASVITEDKRVGPIVCDAVISHIEEEAIINDDLGDRLKIVILRLKSGKWRFFDDRNDVVRDSEEPEYWRA